MIKLEPGARFENIDLSDLDFTNADLAGAVFIHCTARDLKLTGACFQEARFERCRFIRCRFASADLREAVFEKCVLNDDAGHAGAEFAFSQLGQARFTGCDLSFAQFDRSELHGIEMNGCNLRGAVFRKADFSRSFGRKLTKWSGVMRGCNLELADLSEIRIPGCDLSGSNLREALLFDADLEGADLRRCDLTQTMVAGAKFARADVRGAELGGLNVKELATIEGMMVSADQQYGLLSALGLDLYAE